MIKTSELAAIRLFATTTIATAQEKIEIDYSGVLSFEHIGGSNLSEDYVFGEGDVNFRWPTATNLRFGLDLGLESFFLFEDHSNYGITAYYAAGVFEGQFGKASIGMPRGVMGDYFYSPALGGSELFDLEIEFLGTDLFRYLKLIADETDDDIFGVRYDGKIGKIEVATSFSKISDYASSIGEIVARYDAGQWSVTLGSTLFTQQGFSASSSSLEVQGQAGKLSGGMVFNTSDDELWGPASLRAFASYDLNDAIKINTQMMHYQLDGRSDSDIYSFDMSYKHKTGAFVNAGVIASETWNDTVYDVSVGYKF